MRGKLLLILFLIAAAVAGAVLFPAKGWAWTSLLLSIAALALCLSAFEARQIRAGGGHFGCTMRLICLFPCRFCMAASF